MIEFLIRKLQQFAPVSADERAALTGLPIRMRQYSRGELIVAQGSRPDHSCLVMSGITFRFKILPDGGRQIVALQVPGDFVDLHSFVLKPMDHAVAAAAPVSIGHIPHSALDRVLEKHPRLAKALMWDMAVDGANSREWLANIGRKPAYEQIAHLFCEIYFRMDWAGLVKNRGFEFSISQAELGDICGLSTVHVNRSLQSLRRDGLIVLEDRRLTIPEIHTLAKVAGFDPTYLHLLEH